mmetsp:Transcript_106891/g.300553  ORF Transcript_106891/g.300553 Transcript_106891/m.300553 type:complete len:335 (+) Transcript_106891:359-1363(+)
MQRLSIRSQTFRTEVAPLTWPVVSTSSDFSHCSAHHSQRRRAWLQWAAAAPLGTAPSRSGASTSSKCRTLRLRSASFGRSLEASATRAPQRGHKASEPSSASKLRIRSAALVGKACSATACSSAFSTGGAGRGGKSSNWNSSRSHRQLRPPLASKLRSLSFKGRKSAACAAGPREKRSVTLPGQITRAVCRNSLRARAQASLCSFLDNFFPAFAALLVEPGAFTFRRFAAGRASASSSTGPAPRFFSTLRLAFPNLPPTELASRPSTGASSRRTLRFADESILVFAFFPVEARSESFGRFPFFHESSPGSSHQELPRDRFAFLSAPSPHPPRPL